MFHKDTDNDTKTHIMTSFPGHDSVVRVLICTIAFGMGVSIPDIKHVTLWGIPKTVLSLWQMVGRCARSGDQGDASIYVTGTSLGHKPKPAQDVLDLVKEVSSNKSCVRVAILSNFKLCANDIDGIKVLEERDSCSLPANCQNCACDMCSCCNLCEQKCKCHIENRI